MGDQASGQDSNIRWKTVLNRDECDYRSPASSRPHASKSASSGLSMRRQSVYSPSELPLTASSDSLPVHRKATSDVATLPKDAKPFGHLRSSMGRLSLHSKRGMVGKTPLGVIHESTAAENVDGDHGNFALRSDINATGNAWLPEKHAPLSVRNHIKAQLKATDQDRNGMRIRHSEQLPSDDTSSARNRRTTQRGYFDHCLPATPMEKGNKRRIPQSGNMTTSVRHRKQIQVIGGPITTPGYDMNLGRVYGSYLRV